MCQDDFMKLTETNALKKLRTEKNKKIKRLFITVLTLNGILCYPINIESRVYYETKSN